MVQLNQDEFGLPQPIEPNLPPPGDERQEVLKKRTDQLEEQIDQKSNESFAVDPSKMEPDNEILNDIDKGFLYPPCADPKFEYAWTQCKHPVDHPSRMVEIRLAEKIKVNGEWKHPWSVVMGNDPDAKGFKVSAENTCTIGDVLLMRCRKDHYALLELAKRRKSLERQYGTDSSLVEVALSCNAAGGEAAYNKYKNDANFSLFGNEFKMKLDNALRTGNLPGMQINRR
ncbi:hypothetical protein LCGC14_0690100 [marine sediment metagenome]|uniref:Uncharacterized protein n=1 Tax=marine sediment metagenome TaxID=412755 RepID=A0A0F9T6Y6_9ZZZZ|nr:hypothetical protein [Candidatus Aminicenantes bacterium]